MAQAWKCIHGTIYKTKSLGDWHVSEFNGDLYPGARKDFLTAITISDGPSSTGYIPGAPEYAQPGWTRTPEEQAAFEAAQARADAAGSGGGNPSPTTVAPPRFTFQGEYPYNVAKSMGGNVVGTLNDALKLYNHTYGTTFNLNSSGHIKDANGKWMTPDDNATLNHVIRTGHATGYAIPAPAPEPVAPSAGTPLVDPVPTPDPEPTAPVDDKAPEVATSAPTLPEQAADNASTAQAEADAKKAEADAKAAEAQAEQDEKQKEGLAKAAAAQAEADEKQQQALAVATANKQSAKEERLKKIMEMRKPWTAGAASVQGSSDAMVVPPIVPASQVPPPPIP